MLRLVLAFGLTLPAAAIAGQNVGNGGHVVDGFCDGSDAKITQSFDLYIARHTIKNWALDLGDAALSPTEKVAYALHKLDAYDHERATLYQQWLSEFESDRTDLPNNQFPGLTDDIGPYSLPTSCSLSQAAIQYLFPQQMSFRYFFQPMLWKALDNDSRAALILHEIVFRDALNRGHTTSTNTRTVVGMLTSKTFSKFTQGEYDHVMDYLNMRAFYTFSPYFGTSLRLSYVPGMELTLTEANKYCNDLPGDTGLLKSDSITGNSSSSYYEQFKASNLGRMILGPNGDQKLDVWSDTQVQELGVLAITRNANQTATEKHAVICWLNARDPNTHPKR